MLLLNEKEIKLTKTGHLPTKIIKVFSNKNFALNVLIAPNETILLSILINN